MVSFHVIEIPVHHPKANRFIEPQRRRIRYAGRDAHAVHPARLHAAQPFEEHGARQSLAPIGRTRANRTEIADPVDRVDPAIHVRGDDAVWRDGNHVEVAIVAGQPHKACVIVVADVADSPRLPHLTLGCGPVGDLARSNSANLTTGG